MRNLLGLFLGLIVLTSVGPLVNAQTTASVQVRMLRNSDVLQMVADGMKSGDVITAILTSRCNFDVFPPVLRDLRRRGVPDTVILAMKMAPGGPPAMSGNLSKDLAQPLTTPVQIPANRVIEVESAEAVSS